MMPLTQTVIEEQFVLFNRDYFGGELPLPRIVLSHSKTRVGAFSCRRHFALFRSRNTDFTIRISVYYQMTERQWQNVLLHEMIHYYIAYKRIKDSSAHGHRFRAEMERLNRTYGWEISVSVNTQGWKVSESASARKKDGQKSRMVLALELQDGKCFLSVVNPKYALRIEQQTRRVPEIREHAWFVSDNHFFLGYPSVRSLRGRRVSKEVFDQMVSQMTPIKPPGKL